MRTPSLRSTQSRVACTTMLAGALWFCASVARGAGAASADGHPLDERGFVRDWLVAGPYPNPPAEPEPFGFARDLLTPLGGEAQAIPFDGLTDTVVFAADKGTLIAGVGSTNAWGFREDRTFPVRWQALHWEEDTPIVSLNGRFGEIRDWLAAFAACWIQSPTARDVQLRVGSDDGYKLYLNHDLLGAFTASRAAKEDQNVHAARLRAGLNLVLLKITDRTGGHAFCLRVTDRRGRPYPDLRAVLHHPRTKYAALCRDLDVVDVVDRQGFAKIRLGVEPRFTGELPLRVDLGLATSQDCRVTVLVTDGGDREVLNRTSAARLQLERATAFTETVSIAHPGRAMVAVLIQDAGNGTTLAHLARGFDVLDRNAVLRRQAALQRKLEKRRADRARLEAQLAARRVEVKQLRVVVARQYEQIEAAYLRRRRAVVERHGDAGASLDRPFEPVSGPRAERCLNGDGWEIAAGKRTGPHRIDDTQPPADGWEPGWVPMLGAEKYFRNRFFPAHGKGSAYGPTELEPCAPVDWRLSDARIGEGTWFRTRLSIPERWRGRHLQLTAECARHRLKVFLDGTLCGVGDGWPGRVAIDLPATEPGPHELVLLAQRARSYGELTPRHPQCFGLLGDVNLVATGDVAVDGTWIITRWRDASIEARLWLRNRGADARNVTVSCQAVRDGRTRLDLGSQTLSLRPGPRAEVRITSPWNDPELWGIGGKYGDPTLYQLVTTVRDGDTVLDVHATRFGFREFWKDGFHFHLNGKRIFLQGDNPGHRVTSRPYQVLWQHLLRDECNVNTLRTHFEYQQGMIARVADEVGMLVIPQWYPVLNVKGRHLSKNREGALSVEEFLTTAEHRANLRRYAGWVRWLRNHPSVVIYATDNEIFTQAWDTPDKLEANIRNDRLGAVYGRYVKRLDPTRLVTRDGDEGTWGKMGKWQEDPPADMANYHYPDFSPERLVENWESLYEKPVLFGETLYCAYGAWDGWIDAVPSQVAAKAQRCRDILALYRDLEVSGWVGMGPGLDCFTELEPDGSGNPWGVTAAIRDRYKANGRVPELPHYPYFPITWPSRSGPGLKPEFWRFLSHYGYGSVNAYFPDRTVCVPNAVNAAYRESTVPMPALPATRPVEVLLRVRSGGAAVPHAPVSLIPLAGQASQPKGVRTDADGRAWFVLDEPGRYAVRVDGRAAQPELDLARPAFERVAGFAYLPRTTVEVTK